MPFRKGFEGVYDQATLNVVQDSFEFIRQAISDAGLLLSREAVARMVIDAYESGMRPELIRGQVLHTIMQQLKQLRESANSCN